MSIKARLEKSLASGERRDGERLHLYLATTGRFPENTQANVEIHNISSGGMLLETSIHLEQGAQIEVELPDNGLTAATVMWAGDDVYGCAFDQPISVAAIGAVRLKSEAPLPPLFDRAHENVAHFTLGKRLEQMRKKRGQTLAQVAEKLGVSKPTVWAWEKGKARPLDERFPAIAEALGVDINELLATDKGSDWLEAIEGCKLQVAEVLGVNKDQIRIMIDL